MKAIGMISGTSMDAIDVALVETDGEARVAPGPAGAYPYDPELRRRVAAVVHDPAKAEHDPLVELDAAVTDALAAAVERFMADNKIAPGSVDVIGLHGQTILHRPERRFTRQLGDGERFARRLGIDVVSRFRHADVASGGQGAPFVPLYHAALAHGLERPLVVLNLGGVANVTYIGAGDAVGGGGLLAFDTGPSNALLDDWTLRHLGTACDVDGRLALSGRADAGILARLMDNPYFALTPPKSLDRNDFHARARIVEGLSAADGAATLVAFTVASVAAARAHFPAPARRWLATGGGRLNPAIMDGLRRTLGVPVDPVERVGWNGDALEAQAFAYLAVRSLRGLPLSVPTTTGVPRPMPGGVLHRAPKRAA